MRSSREIQWDLEMAPPGGNFLVLDVGTNTVGLGSSCFFQTFPPTAIRSVSALEERPSAGGSDSEVVAEEIAAVAAGDGDSVKEKPALPKERPALPKKRAYRKRKKKEDDPDWMRGETASWTKDLSVRRKITTRSTQRRQDAKNRPEKAPVGGDTADASPSSETIPQPGPIQLQQDGLPQSFEEAGEIRMVSSMEPPPMYLVNLLQYYGWTVTFRDGHRALYTSPGGLVYHSLAKAYETFLRDSSKGEERKSSSCQTVDNGEGIKAPDLDHQTGPSTQDVDKGNLKRRRGRKKRNAATIGIAAPVMPQGPSENQQLAPAIQKTSEKGGEQSSLLPEETVSPSREGTQMTTTPRVTRQVSNKKKNLHVQLPGLRRSARLSGKHTFYGSDSDYEDDTDDYSLYSPETDEERPASSISDDANKVCDEKSEACTELEIPGSEELDCSSEILIQKTQSRSNSMHQDNRLVEVRRSIHGNKEFFSVNMEINLDRECQRNFVDSSEISDNNVVKSREGELVSLAPQFLEVAHEKTKSCNKVDHLMRDAEQFCNNNMVPVVNIQNNSNEDRRCMDLNRTDVPVDDGTGIERGINACFSSLLIPAVNSLASGNNEMHNASTFDVENMEGGAHIPDNVFAKDTLTEEVVYDMLRAQTESKSSMLKKTATGRARKKDSKRCLQHGDNLKVPVPLRRISASKRKSAYGGYSNGRRKKRGGRCGLTARGNVDDDHQKERFPRNEVTALSWLIDAGIMSENEMLVHKVKNDRADSLRGLATRDGICCLCCKKVMSLFEFESHAGSDPCQPWYNICLESGKSLMQCQMEAWEKEKKLRRVGFLTVGADDLDPSDDTCGICADGGNLICCDSCPSTFHQDCIMLKDFPEGRWHCPYCICRFCLAAEGGSDRVNQASSLFTCQQCYRKYHWECTRESGQHEDLAESVLFCGKNCKEVDAGLFRLLGLVNKIEGGFSWTLLKRLDEHEELNSDQKLLFMMECNRKLSMALSVLNECFMPVVDPKTEVNLISHAIYNCGSNFKRLNYAGFYNAILEKDEAIISVASLRFHGRHLAEIPFIATRPMYRRQGMCRHLLKAIEDLLSSLHVKKLIIPATSALLETWMTSFSFKPLEQADRDEIRNLGLVVLPQTILLQKSIPPKGKDCGECDPTGVSAVVHPGKAAPGVHDSQKEVGKETNSESCVMGGQNLPSRCNFESSRDRDEHAAIQSQREAKTSIPTAAACGGDLRLGSLWGPVFETFTAAQNPPTPNRSGAPASLGAATGARLASFDKVLDRSFGCKKATGVGDASVVARSNSMGMAKNVHGNGVFPAAYASAFQWTSSS